MKYSLIHSISYDRKLIIYSQRILGIVNDAVCQLLVDINPGNVSSLFYAFHQRSTLWYKYTVRNIKMIVILMYGDFSAYQWQCLESNKRGTRVLRNNAVKILFKIFNKIPFFFLKIYKTFSLNKLNTKKLNYNMLYYCVISTCSLIRACK